MKLRLLSLCSLLCILSAVLYFQVATALRDRKQQMARLELTREHARALWVACDAYSKTHGNTYPPAAHWEEHLANALHLTRSQMDELVLCPSPTLAASAPTRFALNAAVAGRPISHFSHSPHTVLFFESSDTHRSASRNARDAAPGTFGNHANPRVAVDVTGWADVNNNLSIRK